MRIARRWRIACGDRVVAAGGPLAAPCLFKRARLPQALRRIEGRNGALVFTNVIGALSEKEEDQLIKLALRFRVTILDLARFFRRREGAEQQALLDKLAAAGFPPPLRLAGFPSFRVYLRDREDWVSGAQPNRICAARSHNAGVAAASRPGLFWPSW